MSVGNLPRAAPASQSNVPESTSTPPITTPWPDRNLVAEWKTRSAPCSNGRISHGVVNVESTSSGRPCSCASADDARDVEHVEAGIAERLAEQQPRLGPDRGAPPSRSRGSTNVVVDAEARQRVVEQVVRAAVERARRDDVLARAEERDDREVQRRLPARRGDGAHAAFERRDALFEHRDRRIGDARIDVARALHVEQRRGVIAVRKDERRGLVDRRRARAGGGVGRRARVQRERVEAVRLGLGHRRVWNESRDSRRNRRGVKSPR